MRVNTVLGPVDNSELGVTLSHEHVMVFNNSLVDAFGDKWVDKKIVADVVSKEFREIREKHGVCTVVDATPLNLGRDVRVLEEVSKASGVNIIASSGFYFTDEPCVDHLPAEVLIDLLVDECRNGIQGTKILPGILKIATDMPGITPINRRLHDIMAHVQKQTNLPIYAHTFPGISSGIAQLDILTGHGIDPAKIAIGHSADTFDISYHERLLNAGCYLGIDRVDATMPPCKLQQWIDVVFTLVDRGWIGKLLLAQDMCGFYDFDGNYWAKLIKSMAAGERTNGFAYIFENVMPVLRQKGFTDKEFTQLFVENPKNFFA